MNQTALTKQSKIYYITQMSIFVRIDIEISYKVSVNQFRNIMKLLIKKSNKSLSAMTFITLLSIVSNLPMKFSNAQTTTPLIIDTDMGTDDWLAIAYIAQNNHVNLLGITIVGNGIASCSNAAHNAQYILSMSKRNSQKPISCGSIWPMDGYASYPKIWRETGANMMGEKIPAINPTKTFPDGPTLLAKLLRDSSKPVDILAIGSMTNIASVITAEPSLKSKIKRIISMGGAVNVEGNLRVHGFTDKHTNTKAEWNYYIDPIATKIVFESGVPITLVPLDATNKVPLTKAFIEKLSKNTDPKPLESFALRIFQNISKSITNGEYYHWDPLTAVVASKPNLCTQSEKIKLSVIANKGTDMGLSNGQTPELFPFTNSVGKKRSALNELAAGATIKSSTGNPIDVCMHVDANVFEKQFIETLRSSN